MSVYDICKVLMMGSGVWPSFTYFVQRQNSIQLTASEIVQ